MLIEKIRHSEDILKQKDNEYKYLSPFVYKKEKKYFLLYCNRLSPKAFYGEINFSSSLGLVKWKKEKIRILPPFNKPYKSLVSPSLLLIKGRYFLFVEGQKEKNKSDLLCYVSNNFKDWKLKSGFILSSKNSSLTSPYALKHHNKIKLYYTYNNTTIRLVELDERFNCIRKQKCITKSLKSEKHSIYSPNIFKIKNKYIMLYAAWKTNSSGNINIALSDDGIKWKKISEQIFTNLLPYKIVSEPFALIRNQFIYIYYEYKIKKNWNVGYLLYKKRDFINQYLVSKIL